MKKGIDLGYLSADDFIKRRSNTLLKDPQAKLDEKYEVDNYLSKLDPNYYEEIKVLSRTDSQPISKNVRAIITIVAYNEGLRIRDTLKTYVGQDLNTDKFEIIILDNHPWNVESDNTKQEIEKFREEHPKISIVYAHKVWVEDDIPTVGNARKYVFDIALARLQSRGGGENETILISNDADTIDLDKNYISAIINEFDTNDTVDALATLTVAPYDTITKPNIYGALSLWDALDDVVAEGEPRNLIGRSSAYRASIYAAVGGYNPKGKLAGDLETGFLVADAREWKPQSVILFKKTKHIYDPRRVLEAVASRVPVNEMYYKFISAPEVRNADNSSLLNLIPDEMDWEMLEEDLDSFWGGGGTTGMYKWRGSRFNSDFKKAMDKIGVQYEIIGKRLKLINVDQLLVNYEKDFGRKPKVIHSKKRILDQQRIDDMQRFFFTVTDSAIACRKRMAKKIVKKINLAKKDRDRYALEKLLSDYKRFSGEVFNKNLI